MGFIIIIAATAALLYFLCRSPKTNKTLNIPEIYRVNSISDIVMSVNHGRIYPFYTRMNLMRAKAEAGKICADKEKFDSFIQMQEIMGLKPYFDIPISNSYIERISVMFSNQGLVSSIGIDIKNFDVNMKPLIEEMVVKFGRPTSMSDEFIIWREACMVINIHKEGSLSIIDESIFGR